MSFLYIFYRNKKHKESDKQQNYFPHECGQLEARRGGCASQQFTFLVGQTDVAGSPCGQAGIRRRLRPRFPGCMSSRGNAGRPG